MISTIIGKSVKKVAQLRGGGSALPGLVVEKIDPDFIRRTKVQESNFGGRNANGLKNIVCCSSDNALPFCDTTLSNQAAAASGNC